MKKLIPLLIISTLILTGCGSKSKVQQPQPVQNSQQQDDDEDQSTAEWVADEIFDVDDWGKKKKAKPTVPAKSSTSKKK